MSQAPRHSPTDSPDTSSHTSPHKLAGNLPLLMCLACALLPFMAVQITYLLSASYGFVQWCFPYFDSCTSI
ncbi:MAG: hypothetical protein NWQ45_06565, partial [Congregibacter sp.]|nr:hypothetical protein [Congregibacter sp.]